MRKILILLVTISSLFAATLEQLIDKALANSTSLSVIEQKIEGKKQDVASADLFANPTLAFTKNTLPSDQAMSQSTVSFSQKIYWWGKRDQKADLAKSDVEVEKARLDAAKVKLVYAIKTQTYKIWEIEQLLKVVDEFIDLTKSSKELYEAYSSSDDMGKNHMGIMSAELSLSQLKIKKTKLESLHEAALKRLAYLVGSEVKSVEIELKLTSLPTYDDIKELVQTNPDLVVTKKEIEKKDFAITLADTQNYPDINLLASYAHREKFDDYMNFGVSLSLPIYSKEDIELQKTKIAKLETKKRKADTELFATEAFKEQYAILKAQFAIYNIIHKETMPKIEHMIEVSEAMIQNGTSLFEYIDILERKLNLEQDSIDAVARFYTAKAKIEELKGEMR